MSLSLFPTAIASWALMLSRALDAEGVDAHAITRRAGIRHELLEDPNSRIPLQKMQNLWRLTEQAVPDPCFGLRIAEHYHPTTLQALGYAWLASENLSDALQRFARFVRVVNTTAVIHIDEQRDDGLIGVYVGLQGSNPFMSHHSRLASLAVTIKLFRQLLGVEFKPAALVLPSDCVAIVRTSVENFFQVPLVAAPADAAASVGFVFAADYLRQQLSTGNPVLVRMCDQLLREYLARLDNSVISDRVRAELIKLLPAGRVSEQRIAEALHMSVRSLQRRLQDEGYSYKTLIENTRRELAREYVADQQLSLSEVAYLMGFSDLSNFSRAFKRWEGVAPRHFRERRALETAATTVNHGELSLS